MENQQPVEDRAARIQSIVAALASYLERSTDSIVWIGSGLSIGCGYPDWRETLKQLSEACITQKDDIPPSSMKDDPLKWAEQCKRANLEEYINTLGRLFGDFPRVIRTTYNLINSIPFRYFVTTNYDPCLERVCGYSGEVIFYPDMFFSESSNRTCVYLHGKARHGIKVDATDLVLAKSDFDKAYSHNTSLLPGVLERLVTNHPILFVGCRLEEPALKETLKRIKKIQERFTTRPLSKKMILLADAMDEKTAKKEHREMESLGIEILRYPLCKGDESPTSDRHRLLDEVWEQVLLKLRGQSDPYNQEGGLPS